MALATPFKKKAFPPALRRMEPGTCPGPPVFANVQNTASPNVLHERSEQHLVGVHGHPSLQLYGRTVS